MKVAPAAILPGFLAGHPTGTIPNAQPALLPASAQLRAPAPLSGEVATPDVERLNSNILESTLALLTPRIQSRKSPVNSAFIVFLAATLVWAPAVRVAVRVPSLVAVVSSPVHPISHDLC